MMRFHIFKVLGCLAMAVLVPIAAEAQAASHETAPPPGMWHAEGAAYAVTPAIPAPAPRQFAPAQIPPHTAQTREPAFTFTPDSSPVLIAAFSPAVGGNRALPARNANVFRKHGEKRQPAEIIEKEPVRPMPPRRADESAMTPPSDGSVRRAEVRLPDSSRGYGQASDYRAGF